MFQLRNIGKSFRDREETIHVARGLSWSIEAGDNTALLGESGAGKTTLLNVIAGLDTVDSGEVIVGGSDITHLNQSDLTHFRRHYLGLIFQNFHLIPSLNAWDNAALQARLGQCFENEFAKHLFGRLSIDNLAHRYPSQLSGGQQQRIAIARSLMHKPSLVLADEPTGNLDEVISEKVIDLLVQVTKEVGSTLVVVTHSEAIASHLNQRWRLGSGLISEIA
tara:strand:- start:1317 stop:1979 length:663 start_codon:yes stop_codon:yes gene_type:complete